MAAWLAYLKSRLLLPDTVVLRPVPRYTEYRYAVVNDRRVIVDARTHRIVKIID